MISLSELKLADSVVSTFTWAFDVWRSCVIDAPPLPMIDPHASARTLICTVYTIALSPLNGSTEQTAGLVEQEFCISASTSPAAVHMVSGAPPICSSR